MSSRDLSHSRSRLQYRWQGGHRSIEFELDELRASARGFERRTVSGREVARKLRSLRQVLADFFQTEALLSSTAKSGDSSFATDVSVAAEAHARQAAIERYNVITGLQALILRLDQPLTAPADPRSARRDIEQFLDHLERHMDCESDLLLWFHHNRANT
ncbi:MAG: hypothetical protein ACR2NZ_15300 [Rubripirellula sp.]